MIVEIDSPPIIDYGEVPTTLESQIRQVAEQAVRVPGYFEIGRLSRRVVFGEEQADDMLLHELAVRVGDEYLGRQLSPGSVAVISTITDADAYKRNTLGSKAASNWHQDFVHTDQGFFFTPKGPVRIVIPILAGPLCIDGHTTVANALKIEAVAPPEISDIATELRTGSTLVGADGVLVKSEDDPRGGRLYAAEPGRAYNLPSKTVHRADPNSPTGKILFRLDAVA